MKKIKLIVKNLIRIVLGKILSLIFKRKDNYIIFNAKFGKNNEIFLHNTKYLFLYLNHYLKNSPYKTFWLCDNKQMTSVFKKHGYNNIIRRKSLKGMYYMLRAKFWFYDFLPEDLPKLFLDKAVLINLWHGAGRLKLSGEDAVKNKTNDILDKILKKIKRRDDYCIVNSKSEGDCRITILGIKKEQSVILGSPRIDALYHDFINQNMFMEKDYCAIKKLKEEGKKLIFYVPTFRETKEDISSWLKSDKLKGFLRSNNAVLVCKLHPFDKNSLDEHLSCEFYKMESASDIYCVLKYSDALITDYSSIFFDYLHLDKPIIYYVPDLEEYQIKCRGFYEPYESVTAGEKAYSEEELLKKLEDFMSGIDNYKSQRKALLDRFFVYQDGKNCKKTIEFVNMLRKKPDKNFKQKEKIKVFE